MLQRLQKFLSEAGVCSRRDAEELIQQRKVTVNDQMATLGMKVDPEFDIVNVRGKIIQPQREKLYFAFYKPHGYITTLKTELGQPSIISLFPKGLRLSPVGHLDMNSEGLLLLTNDGDFANRVVLPRYVYEKVYHVKLDRLLTFDIIQKFNAGFRFDGRKTVMKTKFLHEKLHEFRLREGRKHIVRRVCEKFGYHVLELKRVQIHQISLGNLEPGMMRSLTTDEINAFYPQEK